MSSSPTTTVEVSVHPDVVLDERALRREVLRQAKLRDDDLLAVRIVRRTIDARRGRVRVLVQAEVGPCAPSDRTSIAPLALPTMTGAPEVAVVGAGPAGLFCAWRLAQHGIKSVVLERGKDVRARRRDLALLTRNGELHPDSNYCFGEGGAGTFSDGKLYTRSRKRGDVQRVLEAFVAYGASPDIMVDGRPHIGTNRLPGVITQMREHLRTAGVEIAFETRVQAIAVDGGQARGVELGDGTQLSARAVVLAPGHSARDVQRFAAAAGVHVVFKPFAMGVRIEHAQTLVDRIQYGDFAGHPALGAASYRLVEQAGGCGVFSFCMCPGGFIAPAATEPGGQVVNGWSPSSRGGRFANSGFVAEVGPQLLAELGYDIDDPFCGVQYQRALEAAAYDAGGGDYVAPAQTLEDFVAGRRSSELPECSYRRGIASARLDELLGPLTPPLRAALETFGRKMPGFVGPHAVAVGVESRTSCPVRMDRDRDSGEAIGCGGVYPCGEGAGYAGGIMSAALDGMRVADQIARALGRATAT